MADEYKIIGGDGIEYGPTHLEEVREWAADGRVGPATLVWRSDERRWLPASQRHELIWDLPPAEPEPGSPPPFIAGPEFRAAGFWIRVAAYLVDFLAILVALQFVMLPFQEDLEELRRYLRSVDPESLAQDTEKLLAFYRQVLPMVLFQVTMQAALSLTYFVGCHGRFGCTAGKWLLGIQVVGADGSPLGYRRAFWRYSAELLSWLALGIGYLMVAFDPEKRGLHDKLAGTRVVYRA